MSSQVKSTGENPNAAAPSSSSSKVSVKKPGKAAVPKNLKTERGRLFFKSAGSTEWLKIQGMRELDNSNVGPVVFSGDTISITQKAKGNRCNFRLGKSDYRLRDSRFVLGSDNESDMFVGYFSLTPPGTCDFDTDKDDDESLALASACTLATLSSTFTGIRLAVSTSSTDWKRDGKTTSSKPNVLRGQLARLCTGHLLANPKSVGSKIQTDTKALSPTPSPMPIQPDLDTLPTSEKLLAFAQRAEERRSAARAAREAGLAELERKHTAEKANLEREHAEKGRLLGEEIAEEEKALRLEGQID